MSNRRTYLAGKMSGIPEGNFPLFLRTAAKLRDYGFDVICPAEMDIEAGFDARGMTQEEVIAYLTPQRMREIIRRDLDAILTLRPENHDFITLLPGWESSRGAGAEAYLAQWMGLELYKLDFSCGCGTLQCEPQPSIAEIELAPVTWRLKNAFTHR